MAGQFRRVLERRLFETGRRGIANDGSRKKRREDEDEEDDSLHSKPSISNSLIIKNVSLAPSKQTLRPNDILLVRIFSRLIRSSSLQKNQPETNLLPSGGDAIETALSRPPPFVNPRFPDAKDEHFLNFSTLKSHLGASRNPNSKILRLSDGDTIEIGNKSLGDAFEIRLKKNCIEPDKKCLDQSETERTEDSFDLISGSLSDENVYPPLLIGQIVPLLNPFTFKINPPTAPFTPPLLVEQSHSLFTEQCDSDFVHLPNDSEKTPLAWQSEATSDVELSFGSASLANEDGAKTEALPHTAPAARKRKLSLNSLAVPSRRRNPFCAVPLDLFAHNKTKSGSSSDGDQRNNIDLTAILRLAFVTDAISEHGRGFWDSSRQQSRPAWVESPFICEGKIFRLMVDSPSCQPQSAFPSTTMNTSSSSMDFLITPKFDLTLAEYLQQTNDASVKNRLSLFLQSLESVAHLHNQGFSHGNLQPADFLLDLDEPTGDTRILLSNFSKLSPITDEGCQSDSLRLGQLALSLFNDDLNQQSECVNKNDLPVLNDAPLDLDIILHSLMSDDPGSRISPSVAANMLHLCFWRDHFFSDFLNSPASTPSSPTESLSPQSSLTGPCLSHLDSNSQLSSSLSGFASDDYASAKRHILREFSARSTGGVPSLVDEDLMEKRDVKSDLTRSFFARANFQDVLHADSLLKKGREDLWKFVETKDKKHLHLFIEEDR